MPNVLADIVLSRRISCLVLCNYFRFPLNDAAPLVRLLEGRTLTALTMRQFPRVVPIDPRFIAAIRSSRLVRLNLSDVQLFADLPAALSLITAVTAHPTLQDLCRLGNRLHFAEFVAPVAKALRALVAADCLTSLNILRCGLSAAGLAPLVAALPAVRRLAWLDIRFNLHSNDNEAAFMDQLLRAVQRNASLRTLKMLVPMDES